MILRKKMEYYAVIVRYPDEFYSPSVQEAIESFNVAKKVRLFVERKLK